MIEKTVLLACSLERAFTLFTEHASEWWPPERRHTGDAESQIALVSSGRFYERARDGREVEIGKIREWSAPARLLFDFYPGTDAEHPTEVEVLFSPEPDGVHTRVTVLHRATESSKALFEGSAPRYQASWELLLGALCRFTAELAHVGHLAIR